MLVVPVAATIVVLAEPGRPLWFYLVCAALCGLGGGNFASSMTNINAFFPQRLKGVALGINAGGGNIGVPAVQLVGLLVIAIAGNRQPYWVCAFYLVALIIAAIGASRFMDNLDVVSVDLGAMGAALRSRHTWLVSLLYVGTFGSFIGFSFWPLPAPSGSRGGALMCPGGAGASGVGLAGASPPAVPPPGAGAAAGGPGSGAGAAAGGGSACCGGAWGGAG